MQAYSDNWWHMEEDVSFAISTLIPFSYSHLFFGF